MRAASSQGSHQGGWRPAAQLVTPSLSLLQNTSPIPLPCPGCAALLTVTQAAFGRTSSCPRFTLSASASPLRDDSHRANPLCPCPSTVQAHPGSAIASTVQSPTGRSSAACQALPQHCPCCQQAGIEVAAPGRNFQPLTLISSPTVAEHSVGQPVCPL